MKNIALVLFFAALYMPLAAHAETVLRVGDDVSVEAKQVVDGNYYVSAGPFGTTNMSGTVKQDMYAFGGMVNTNGPIGSDLTIVSGAAQVHAPVAGDVRIVSGTITIADHVGGDLFVIGGSLQVLSTATIDGNVYFFGGQADIEGKVGGSIMGSANQMRINAAVGKNVNIKTVSALTLGNEANIAGTVQYASLNKMIRAQNAIVSGAITQTAYAPQDQSAHASAQRFLIPLFITLFTTLSLYLLFKKELYALVTYIHKSTLKSGLLGLGVLVLGPIAAVILMVTVLGAAIGVICLALVLLAYLVGFFTSGVVLGSYVSLLLTKKSSISLPYVLCGTILLEIIFFIPIIGPLVVIAFTAITAGALVLGFHKLVS